MNIGTKSIWNKTEIPDFKPLMENTQADVCIIGAGIAGLSCAYQLAKQGKSVIILDKDSAGSGQSSRTTAHLSWILNDRYYELEDYFGEDISLIAKSHAHAIDLIEKTVASENINCDFERLDGYLFSAPNESKDLLLKEFEILKKMGMNVNTREKAPFNSDFNTGTCLCIPQQAQFHPMKYMQGLVKAILQYKGRIYTQTHVNTIEEKPESLTDPTDNYTITSQLDDGNSCLTTTKDNYTVTSKSVIVATCSPINDRFYIHTKQAAYRTYVIAAEIPKGSQPKGLFWDTEDPYHYVRLQKHEENPNLEWIIIGGEDHRTGQNQTNEQCFIELEKWAKARFSNISSISYRWSGQVFNSMDSIGFIGQNPGNQNIYIVTGDTGNGMTNGTIAGELVSSLILKQDHPWSNLYAPSRKKIRAAPTYLSENLNSGIQYSDWLTPGNVEQFNNMKENEGIVLRKGINKIAVYKDSEGNVHLNSAFCPHLGGCVRWNPVEKSWDCPVHGARYSGCGKIINAPACSDLQKSD